MADENRVAVELVCTPKGLELFDQAGKKVGEFSNATGKASGVLAEALKGVREGFDKELEAALKAAQGHKGVESSFSSLGAKVIEFNQLLEVGQKVLGGLKTAFDGVFAGIDRGGMFDDLSKRIGVSVETLSSFELAAKTSGVSLESFGTGIQMLSRNMASAAGGSKEAQEAFAALGVSVTDANGNLRSSHDVLLEISDAFSNANDGAAKTALAMDLLGRSGAQLIPFLNEGADGLRKWQQLSSDLGLNMTTELAASMDAIGDSVEIFGAAITGVQNQLAIGLAPALSEISAELVTFVSQVGIGDGTIRGFGESLGTGLKSAFDSLRDSVREAAELFTTLDFDDALEVMQGRLGVALESAFETAIWAAARASKNVFLSAVDYVFGSVDITSVVQTKNAELMREVLASAEQELNTLGLKTPEQRAQASQFDANVRQTLADIDALKGRLGELAGQQLVADAAAAKHSAGLVDQQVAANLAALGIGEAGDSWRFYEQAGVSATKRDLAVPVKNTGEAAKKAADEIAKLRDRFEEQIRTQTEAVEKMEGQNEALQQIIDGNLSAADAQTVLNDATGEAAAVAALATGATTEEAAALGNLAIAAAEAAQANRALQATRSAQTQTQALTQEAAILQQVLAGTKSQIQAEHELAVIREQSKGVTLEQAEAFITAQENVEELRDRIQEMDEDVIHLGDIFKDSFEQAFDAVISGTRDMGDVLEGIGIGIGKRFFSAMLESKLKDFDPTVKANFLDLGEFGKSVFGDLFSDAGTGGGSGGGSGGGVLDWVNKGVDWLGSLGSAPSPSSGLEIIGQNADGSFIFSDGSSAWGQSIDDGSSSASGSSFAGDLLGGAVAGFGTSTALNPYVFRPGATSLTGLAARGAEPGIFSNANVINGVIGTIIGAILGAMGLGSAGGVIGGAISSGIGALVMDSIDRDALRNRRFSGGLAGGIEEMESWFGFMGKDGLSPASLIFNLLGIPTLGTAFRRAGESMIDSSQIFGKEGLQGLLGDFTRDKNGRLGLDNNYDTGGQTALDRGFTEEQLQKVLGASTNIFSVLAEGEYAADAGRFAEEMGQSMAEFLSRGLAEGMTFDELFGSLRQFAAESGVTLMASIKNLPEVFAQSAAAASEFGKLDVTTSHEQGAHAYAQALYGITEIFKGDFPAGVNLASLALQTMELDGVKVFENLDTEGKETLQNLTEDAELFQEVVAKLAAQGFTIDTEEFEKRLEAITQSATFLGENLGAIFNFDSAAAGVEAIFQQLKGDIFQTFQATSMEQLFGSTNIAAAFEPVYAALDRIDEFDLTTATGAQDFMAILTPALAEGKANLQDYIPILQVMIDNWKEIQKIIDEAMKPDVFEQAALVAEEAFNGIGGALSTAIEVGLAVLNDGGTWDDAVNAFNGAFGAGIEKTFKDAIFNAIVQSALVEPLIASYQPAFAYVVAAGMTHGFKDPRVKEALEIVMGQARRDAEELGLAIFTVAVDNEALTSDIERAFNDAADITVDWAGDVRGMLSTALDAAFDVLRAGGSRDAALAAWSDSLGDGTEAGITDGIVRALVNAAIIEPFIKQWAPIIQYWVAAGLAIDPNDPEAQRRFREAGEMLFGPDSDFQQGLNNIPGVAIDWYWNYVGGDAPPGYEGKTPSSDNGKGTNSATSFRGGFAMGGAVPHGSSFIVGEAGPELVLTDGSGSTIIPLDPAVANAMLNGGVAGYADGSVPRGHGPVRPPLNPGPGGLGPLGRPKIPPMSGRSSRAAAAASAVDVEIDLNLDDAIETFLRGGSLKDFQKALEEGSKAAVIDGLVKGMLESGPIKKAIDDFNAQMSDAVEKAMRDGVIDAQEQADLDALGVKLSGSIETAAKAMQPVVESVGKALGIGMEQAAEEAAGSVSASLDAAIRTFLSGGSVEDMEDAVNQAIYDATTSGIIEALLTTGPLAAVIDKFGAKVGKAISDALDDGEIDAKEARRIRRIGKRYGGEISEAIKALGPVLGPLFEEWAGELGLDLKNEIVSIEGLLSGSVRQALLDGSSFGVFQQNVKQALYESIVDGMVQAFIDSAVINGLLAGPLGVINATFAQIADGQLTVAEANKIIFQQIGVITGLLDSPAFKAAWDVINTGIEGIRSSLGIATSTVVDAAQGFNEVANAAENACAGECEWERKLVESEEKNATLDEFGRQGTETTESYSPVPKGPSAENEVDINDTLGGGDGVYGHPSDLIGYWERREIRQARRRNRRLNGPDAPDDDVPMGPPGNPPDDGRDFVGPNAATNGPMLVQDEGIAALRAEVASLRQAILNMPPPTVTLDGREISKSTRRHERRESRGGQSTQWGIS